VSSDRFNKYFDRYPEAKLRKFISWHKTNPEVYKEFVKLAKEMQASGRERYSAETIINVLRWHRDLKTVGDEFKISNDFRSMFARLLVYQKPEFEGFFSMKGLDDA